MTGCGAKDRGGGLLRWRCVAGRAAGLAQSSAPASELRAGFLEPQGGLC